MPVRVQLPDLEHWKSQVKCQAGCPVKTDAGRYVQLIAEGRDEEAFLVARAPNPFASVCGRVCAAPCEDACRRGNIDAPDLDPRPQALRHRAVRRRVAPPRHPGPAARAAHPRGQPLPRPPAGRPLSPAGGEGPRRKVAVVGAGPAGMSAAHDLALLGYDVTVFDASAEPGGMMRFGIPEYRLPRTLIHEEIQKILSLGVTLRSGVALTESYGLAELRRDGFEAVFLSVGVSKGRDLQVPGVELDGVVKAVDYLLNVNRGFRMNLGRRVVVIGGGFVAFDAARTALRLGREEEAARARRRDRRAHEGGLRLGPRRPARRGHRGHDRLARELRRDAGAPDDAGARGVRGVEEGGRRLPAPPRPEAVPRATGRLQQIELRGVALGLRRERPLQPPLRRRGRPRPRRRRLRPRHRPEARPVVPEARRTASS